MSLRTWALLARAPSLTADRLRSALESLGSPEALAGATRAQLAGLPLPPGARDWLAAPDLAAVDADVAWIEAAGARLVPCTAPEYPPLLASLEDAPAVLYVLGDPAVLSRPQLAMVGSRNPTAVGRSTARDFAGWFAGRGLVITSGLALGIDAASHEGALAAGGFTVAVCGTGLDAVYPPRHRDLAVRIRDHGALVSELPPRTPPLRHHFPRRNRLISGLALGTLVVEAARDSGSLVTARHALEQGRDVFAIPGSIHNPLARGCHQLIRDGARLVERGDDVLEELRNFVPVQPLARPPTNRAGADAALPAMDKEYEMLLDAVGFEPASIDSLVDRTGLAAESIASMLLILELQGHVASQPGGRYCRLPSASR